MGLNARALYPVAALWLCLVSLQAPFAHFHPKDPDHHHATGLVHLHVGHTEYLQHPDGDRPALDHGDAEEPAVWADWALTGSERSQIVFAHAAVVHVYEPGFAVVGSAPYFTARSHDPPELISGSARAPPL